jgi:hypothetical protein
MKKGLDHGSDMVMLDNKKLLKYHHLKDKVNQVFNAS